jgi:hypothetical protein
MTDISVVEQVVQVEETSETTAILTVDAQVVPVDVGIAGPQGATGAAGPTGPQGPPGSIGGSYLHAQIVPSAIWTINHNLGFFPNVVVLDTLGRVVWGDQEYPSANTMILTFSASFSGTAYLS